MKIETTHKLTHTLVSHTKYLLLYTTKYNQDYQLWMDINIPNTELWYDVLLMPSTTTVEIMLLYVNVSQYVCVPMGKNGID